jgi:import inner membrane translocase subunit TIM54
MSTTPVTKDAPKPFTVPVEKRNPALKAMGMFFYCFSGRLLLIALGIPNFKFKLPSRNWLIFLSVSGTITSLILYDRHHKKKAQEKWCRLVSHIAEEPLSTTSMPRKVTVFLSAPPGDGLKPARDHFVEYIKPILVAAALDWDVVEGRKEGEVREKLADKIRIYRQEAGEGVRKEIEEDLIAETRRKAGTREWNGTKGDIVIGRHTWKEYMRGLHEGWLGPLEPPAPPTVEVTENETPEASMDDETAEKEFEVSSSDTKSSNEEVKKDLSPKPASKTATATAFIPTAAYAAASLPSSTPPVFDPSSPLPLPHILGFLNTPTRVYRFFTRRRLADQMGRETAAAVLESSRAYNQSSYSSTDVSNESSTAFNSPSGLSPEADHIGGRWEQQDDLVEEEPGWHKSVRKRTEDEGERVWLDGVVVDPRIVGRMRRFELTAEDESKAREMASGQTTGASAP